MKIVVISDTHGQHEDITLPKKKGDIIIHAGDCSSTGTASQIEDFLIWYGGLNYKLKILIAGNHDWGFDQNPKKYEEMAKQYGVTYLNDSGITYKKIKIWGSPVSPTFCDWAFNRSRTIEESMTEGAQKLKHPYIGNHWDLIPLDTDILITHGPPYGIMDYTVYDRLNVGCSVLSYKIHQIKPKLVIFGHIHEARGVLAYKIDENYVTYCNASSLDLRYNKWDDDQFVFNWKKVLSGTSRGRDY